MANNDNVKLAVHQGLIVHLIRVSAIKNKATQMKSAPVNTEGTHVSQLLKAQPQGGYKEANLPLSSLGSQSVTMVTDPKFDFPLFHKQLKDLRVTN